MSTKEEYLEMLRAARERLPKGVVVSGERFTPPTPVVIIEGRQTHLINFKEICDALNRDPKLVARYLSRELGSPYMMTGGGKLILSRRIDPQLVDARVKRFIERYVLCPICGRPDTKLVKVKRTLVLKCLACGAETPVPKV